MCVCGMIAGITVWAAALIARNQGLQIYAGVLALMWTVIFYVAIGLYLYRRSAVWA